MASSMYTAPWMRRFTRLPAVRKFEFSDWNRIEMMMSPAMTGRAPASPERVRTAHARTYSPKVWAMSSGAATRAALSASGRSSSSTTLSWGSSGLAIAALLRQPGRGPGRHEVDDDLEVELRDGTHGDDASEEEHGDAVGHLEHVVHVVGDHQYGQALVGQPAHQVEDVSGLRHTERSGGLVHDHQLGVPQDS